MQKKLTKSILHDDKQIILKISKILNKSYQKKRMLQLNKISLLFNFLQLLKTQDTLVDNK